MPHRGFDTPREYDFRLVSVFPDTSSQLAFITEVLEEALFSMHLLPGERVRAYFSTVREIRQGGARNRVSTAGKRPPQA